MLRRAARRRRRACGGSTSRPTGPSPAPPRPAAPQVPHVTHEDMSAKLLEHALRNKEHRDGRPLLREEEDLSDDAPHIGLDELQFVNDAILA